MNSETNYWHDEMSVEIARSVLGARHFDYSVQQGAAFCSSRAGFAWQANNQEHYGAYKAAERAAKDKHSNAVLAAFDDMSHAESRQQRERASEIHRKARNLL